MDHAHAYLSECIPHLAHTTTIESEFTHEEEGITLEKSEKGMHNKEQSMQSAYFKKLSDHILNFDEVLLFGPTDAKVELFNILQDDHRFANIKISVQPADKMSENQRYAFIKEYFSQ